ncbi:MAG TPA: hypothetical protein VMM76_04055 [Pirellulaceae bacterium]|nr:hypothetical protein [Pirellulaceae bacterium]
MSVGPMGMAASVAGGLPQIRSADAGRAEKQSADQARQTKSDQKAEAAEGVGETTQDEKASDRDADGRRSWEAMPEQTAEPEDMVDEAKTPKIPQSKDPTGTSGGQLDLHG